jgi:hypothetical protein
MYNAKSRKRNAPAFNLLLFAFKALVPIAFGALNLKLLMEE